MNTKIVFIFMTDKHGLQYISATYRMFKCCQDGPDPHTDYVQVTYNGGIQGQQEMYKLSCDFSFQVIPCFNTTD